MLTQSAPDCLSAHRSDVQTCAVSTRRGLRYPNFTADELKIAKPEHIHAQAQHMTPQWSLFLAPVLDGVLTRI